ncbi:hypothetical protein TWF191_007078 [Orbilia oligospora]|uniref:Uncharacterized protein n=1 Tax=Orbilia oligospora TaxID=2813651 RepID=A0A7C8UVM3_ORBOL|nr:hypothetical protein TWF191_007078 [Orbilia oligospora]
MRYFIIRYQRSRILHCVKGMITHRPMVCWERLIISLSTFLTQASGTPVGGNLLTGIANLAKSEALNWRQWDKITVDNDYIEADLKHITDVASEFQDGGIVSGRDEEEIIEFYPLRAGFLCGILERLNTANYNFEEFSLKLLDSHKISRDEIEGVQEALASLDQSVKLVMNEQVEDIGWKPRVPRESK